MAGVTLDIPPTSEALTEPLQGTPLGVKFFYFNKQHCWSAAAAGSNEESCSVRLQEATARFSVRISMGADEITELHFKRSNIEKVYVGKNKDPRVIVYKRTDAWKSLEPIFVHFFKFESAVQFIKFMAALIPDRTQAVRESLDG
jgi:hypothetical protein